MYRCYLRGGRICQASPPTCPSWTGRMDDNIKLIIIIVCILYRCTTYGPLGIFKSPVAPFVLIFRLSTECPFSLPRAKPLYTILKSKADINIPTQHHVSFAPVRLIIYACTASSANYIFSALYTVLPLYRSLWCECKCTVSPLVVPDCVGLWVGSRSR